jgi:hypothetical protein
LLASNGHPRRVKGALEYSVCKLLDEAAAAFESVVVAACGRARETLSLAARASLMSKQ